MFKALTPSRKLVGLVREVVDVVLEQRSTQFETIKTSLQKELKVFEKAIDDLLDRIVETTNASVISVYENRIAKLERQKLVTAEKLSKTTQPKLQKREFIELSLQVLANPWKLWGSGNLLHQKMLLRLAFDDRLTYCRNEGYRTPKMSIPFKVLADICNGKCDMVRVERLELPRLAAPEPKSGVSTNFTTPAI